MCTKDRGQYHQTCSEVLLSWSLLTKNGKYDKEIKMRIGMAKDGFQKLQKIVKKQQAIIRQKKMDIILLCKTYPDIR